MTQHLYIHADLFAAAILTILYCSVFRDSGKRLFHQQLFLTLLLFTIGVLFIDAVTWLMDGASGPGMRILHLFCLEVYFMLCPMPMLFWSLYAHSQLHGDRSRTKRLLLPLLIPVLLNAILVITSLFTNSMFSVSLNNVYRHGPLQPLLFVFCGFYLVFTFVQIATAKNKLDSRLLVPLLLFPVLPMVGGLVELLGFGSVVAWLGVSLSLLMVYLNIQNHQIDTDYLTGLFNRKQLAAFLDERIRRSSEKRPVAGILLDIDNLKTINDTYGHLEGDCAIVNTAKILTNSVGKDAFVARFAGDEFMVILKERKEQLEQTVQSIVRNIDDFNARSTTPYKLELSMGYDLFDASLHATALGFTDHIDVQMYQVKNNKKVQ